MVRVMVAVDHSDGAKAAFYTGLSLLRHTEDELFLLTVCGHAGTLASLLGPSSWLTPSIYNEAQEKMKRPHMELLRSFARLCVQNGVRFSFQTSLATAAADICRRTQVKSKVHLVLGMSDHVGDMICQAVEEKTCDFLVVGRRGMSKIKRYLPQDCNKQDFHLTSSSFPQNLCRLQLALLRRTCRLQRRRCQGQVSAMTLSIHSRRSADLARPS